MPHCIVEHSATIDSELLLPLVFSGAFNSQLFEADGGDIKVRAIAYNSYVTGPRKSDFVHVKLRILSGRNLQQKQTLSHSVLEQLKTLRLKDCSISVEVIDIDRASYAKVVTE